jgi:hypothetical protein
VYLKSVRPNLGKRLLAFLLPPLSLWKSLTTTGSVMLLQALNSLVKGLRRKMSVSHRHFDAGMPKELGDRSERHATADEPGSERMAKLVQPETGVQTCPSQSRLPGTMRMVEWHRWPWPRRIVEKYPIIFAV